MVRTVEETYVEVNVGERRGGSKGNNRKAKNGKKMNADRRRNYRKRKRLKENEGMDIEVRNGQRTCELRKEMTIGWTSESMGRKCGRRRA
jgi:hypothetical protein